MKTGYVSEFTQFIQQKKQQNPDWEAGQQKGRAIFWRESPIDLQRQAALQQAQVAQNPYVYQSK